MEPQSIHNGHTPDQNPATEVPDVSLSPNDQTSLHFTPPPSDSMLDTSVSFKNQKHEVKADVETARSPAEETQSRPLTEVFGEKVKTWWNSLKPFDQGMGVAWTGLAFLEANIALMHPIGSSLFIAHTCFCAGDLLLAAVHFLRTKGTAAEKKLQDNDLPKRSVGTD